MVPVKGQSQCVSRLVSVTTAWSASVAPKQLQPAQGWASTALSQSKVIMDTEIFISCNSHMSQNSINLFFSKPFDNMKTCVLHS